MERTRMSRRAAGFFLLLVAGLVGGTAITIWDPSWPVAFALAIVGGILLGTAIRRWVGRD